MEQRKDKDPGIERRKHLRIYATFVEYSPVGEAASKETPSFVENISAGGVCILVSEEMAIDTLLALKIYLPDGKDPIGAKGKVRWMRKSSFLNTKQKKHYDIGLEFVEINEDDRKRIYQYTSSHSDEKSTF